MANGIYCIRNIINKKQYIGQTTNLKKRKKTHINALKNKKHRNEHLQNSFNKYGKENFIFIILEENIPEDMLDAFERFYISTWDTMNPKRGYNKESGGNALKYFSKESREKMSKAQSGENNAGYRFDLKENINIISKLYEEGHTPQYIGEQFNADSTTIRKHLRENSISLRDISEAKRGEKMGCMEKFLKTKDWILIPTLKKLLKNMKMENL